MASITSANSQMRIVVPRFFPGGFSVQDYSADDMFSTDAVTNVETRMSADGRFHAGFIYQPIPININLQPTSPSGKYIDNWFMQQRAIQDTLECNISLIIPAIKTKYDLVNGYIVSWNIIPPGGSTLQVRTLSLLFENVSPSPL